MLRECSTYVYPPTVLYCIESHPCHSSSVYADFVTNVVAVHPCLRQAPTFRT